MERTAVEMMTLLGDLLGVQRQKKPRRHDHEKEPSELRDLILCVANRQLARPPSAPVLLSLQSLSPRTRPVLISLAAHLPARTAFPPCAPSCPSPAASKDLPHSQILPAGNPPEVWLSSQQEAEMKGTFCSSLPAPARRCSCSLSSGAFVQPNPNGWERGGRCHPAGAAVTQVLQLLLVPGCNRAQKLRPQGC